MGFPPKVVPLISSFYATNVREDYFEKELDTIKEYAIVDLMCHPAFVENNLVEATSYALPRMDEYSLLTDEKVKTFLEAHNIVLVNYSDYK